MKIDTTLLPYGAYLKSDGSAVLFDRRYRPLVRLGNAGPPLDLVVHDKQRRPRDLLIPLGDVTPVDPAERIEHRGQVWFYADDKSPRRDRGTRAMLAMLCFAVPGLASEIKRRARRAH